MNQRAQELQLGEASDQVDGFVASVALSLGVLDELFRFDEEGAPLGRTSDRDPASSAELEQAFVAQDPKRPEQGVRVDAEYGREILGEGQTLARLCLAFRDRATNLSGDLLVEIGGIAAVYLDIQYCAIHSSVIVLGLQA